MAENGEGCEFRVASSGLRVVGCELRVGEASEGRAVSVGKVEQEIRWRMGRVVGEKLERVRRTAPALRLESDGVQNAVENRLGRGGGERLRVAGRQMSRQSIDVGGSWMREGLLPARAKQEGN